MYLWESFQESFQDETLQQVREKLWVSKDGSPTKIAQYQGRGHLRRWLRILINRCIADLMRKSSRDARTKRELAEVVPATSDDPRLAAIKRACQAEFKVSFQEALRELSSGQRLLLRQHYLDRLTLDELATLQGVHPVTVSRRLTKARRSIVGAVRKSLRIRLQLQADEVESLLGLIESQLELTLSRLLGTVDE